MPKTFSFTPDFQQAGVYNVLFEAVNVTKADSEWVAITVLEAGNQAPVFTQSPPETETVLVGNVLMHNVVAADPDGDAVTMSLVGEPSYVTFVDSGNGSCSMIYAPPVDHAGLIFNFLYIATDDLGRADTASCQINVAALMRGDANNDASVNIGDVTFLVRFVFKQGETPEIEEAADANFDGSVNVSDAVYLVNFIFKDGPPPHQGK
jgi:hypothetical protein